MWRQHNRPIKNVSSSPSEYMETYGCDKHYFLFPCQGAPCSSASFSFRGAKWTASVGKLRQIARFNLESAGKRRAGSGRFDGNMPAVTHDCGRAQTRGNTCSKRSVCMQCSINFLCEITGVLCLYMQQCPPVVTAGKVKIDFFISFFFLFFSSLWQLRWQGLAIGHPWQTSIHFPAYPNSCISLKKIVGNNN